MLASAMIVLALAGASAPEADERLCQRVLALANGGALEGAFAVAGPANDVDPALAARWQEDGYAGVAGAYDIARADGDGPDDRVCAAVRDGTTEPVESSPVEDRSEVPEALGGVEELASAAPDWFGDGHPRATWLIGDESGAGCGTTYRWLALAGTDAGPPVIDTTSAAGRALYPRVEHERVANGPWLLDGVYAFAGRAWFAGQPQWGAAHRGEYAVYRVDPDGVHAQCRYRHLTQFRIGRRAF